MFVLTFIGIKVVLVWQAIQIDADLNQTIDIVWDDETEALFAAIISFWFGSRAMPARKKWYLRYLNNWITKEVIWIYLGEYWDRDQSISLERVDACEEKTSQAKPRHVKRVIKNQHSTLVVYYKLEEPSIQMDELNFHTMSLEDLENLKEYLLDSRQQEEAYSERAVSYTHLTLPTNREV